MALEKHEDEEIISANNIHIPSPEEIATLSPEELHCEIWRKNNDVFIAALEKRRPRYFGLHGTPGKNLQSIQQTKTARVNIGTFFDKTIEPEFLLTVLYDICHTQFYAFDQPSAQNDPGGVMIIDAEEAGTNRSIAWELLSKSSYNPLKLSFHTEQDMKILHANHPAHAHRADQNSQRSEAVLTPVSFEQRVRGVYPWEQGKLFKQKFEGLHFMWRSLVQDSFGKQNMLKFCLERLGILEW